MHFAIPLKRLRRPLPYALLCNGFSGAAKNRMARAYCSVRRPSGYREAWSVIEFSIDIAILPSQ